ncbi:MAG: CheR family methyltransferase, partial [Candidatus Geothermincolales bacterium]
FTQKDGAHVVREEISRMVKFMRHDIATRPPLRHFDLILCRNVLIYFEKAKQRKIMENFCEVLRKGGMLVLGKSEAILFGEGLPLEPYRRRLRIYRRV